MPDHIAYMLDSMITAVDGSLSYDGIVSVPEIGLEDVKPQTSLTDSLRDGVDRVRKTGTAISRGANRAASALKRKQRNSDRLTPEGGIREKNRSEQSLAPSDQQSEDLIDEKLSIPSVAHSERSRQSHFVCEQVVAQRFEFYGDTVPGCIPRPFINRAHSEPNNGKDHRSAHPEWTQTGEEWHIVLPDDTSQDKLPEKNNTRRRSRMIWPKRGSERAKSVELPDVNQEGLPKNEELESKECAESGSEKQCIGHLSAEDER